jgi:hypothetical protein
MRMPDRELSVDAPMQAEMRGLRGRG